VAKDRRTNRGTKKMAKEKIVKKKVAKKKVAKKKVAKRIHGLPRTAREAVRRGGERVDIDFDEMSAREQKKWTTISSTGVEHQDIGRFRVGPGAPGTFIICYFDKKTGNYDICRSVKA
jgi:hypothetical protein